MSGMGYSCYDIVIVDAITTVTVEDGLVVLYVYGIVWLASACGERGRGRANISTRE